MHHCLIPGERAFGSHWVGDWLDLWASLNALEKEMSVKFEDLTVVLVKTQVL